MNLENSPTSPGGNNMRQYADDRPQSEIVRSLAIERSINRHPHRQLHGYTLYMSGGCECPVCYQAYLDSLEPSDRERARLATVGPPAPAEPATETAMESDTNVPKNTVVEVLEPLEARILGVLMRPKRHGCVNNEGTTLIMRQTGYPRSSVIIGLVGLENRGLIERDRTADDYQRVTRVAITDLGRRSLTHHNQAI